MKSIVTAGIICEFNPFHLGHKYLIESVRKSGADRIVCVMSGNFVQRGEAAIADKYTRAEMAVLCGADLVLELPFPYCAASAGYFAFAGVNILDRLGIVDELWFGSECGDIEVLNTVAENMLSDEFENGLSARLIGGVGYASALDSVYTDLYGATPVLSTPNGTLAVEYIMAIKRLNSRIIPRTIKRYGDYKSDEVVQSDGFASASALRKRIKKSNSLEDIKELIPYDACSVLERAKMEGLFPANDDAIREAMLAYFRLSTPSELAKFDGVVGGLENRIIDAARESSSYEDFISALSTKKYTDSRLRRTLLSCIIGVTKLDMKTSPAYTMLLAANERGRELLSSARRCSEIPIVTKPADIEATGDEASRQAALSDRADALFTLCVPQKRDAAFFRRKTPFVAR